MFRPAGSGSSSIARSPIVFAIVGLLLFSPAVVISALTLTVSPIPCRFEFEVERRLERGPDGHLALLDLHETGQLRRHGVGAGPSAGAR